MPNHTAPAPECVCSDEICHFAYEGSTFYCHHDAETYVNTSMNAVLTLYGGSDTPVTPDFMNSHTGEYKLYPLGIWWLLRGTNGSATSEFYRTVFTYESPGSEQPGRGLALTLPKTLNSDDVSNNDGLHTPWAWFAEDGFGLQRGVWFVDPAYGVQMRNNVPAGYEVSDYCFNLFTGIDRTQSMEAACQHQ